jgi:hypothetical protein
MKMMKSPVSHHRAAETNDAQPKAGYYEIIVFER